MWCRLFQGIAVFQRNSQAPSVFPKSRILAPGSCAAPRDPCHAFVSFQRGNVLRFPRRLSSGFAECFVQELAKPSCQCRGLCRNGAPNSQLGLPGGILTLSSIPDALWLCWNGHDWNARRSELVLLPPRPGHLRACGQTSRICGNAPPRWQEKPIQDDLTALLEKCGWTRHALEPEECLRKSQTFSNFHCGCINHFASA